MTEPNLRFPAVFCENLPFPAKICNFLWFPAPSKCWNFQEKGCICENQRFSAKICVLGSLCHLSSVPLSAPTNTPRSEEHNNKRSRSRSGQAEQTGPSQSPTGSPDSSASRHISTSKTTGGSGRRKSKHTCKTFTLPPECEPYPQYGWDSPEKIPEKFRKDPGNALRAFPGILLDSTARTPQTPII